MTTNLELWRTNDRARWFLVTEGQVMPPGDLAITAFDARTALVDARWAGLHEVGEAEGRDWAREELGETLGALRRRIDARLAAARAKLDDAKHRPVAPDSPVTPDAVPAIFALVKSLPRVVLDSLSGDPARVMKANGTMTGLQQRLNESGVGVDRGLADFPLRLAGLRRDFEMRRKPGDDR